MSQQSSSRRRVIRLTTVVAAAAAGLLVLSGCSPNATGGGEGQFGFTEAEQVPDSEITVWVDASREPAVTAFQEAYPDIPVKLEAQIASFCCVENTTSGQPSPAWSMSVILLWNDPLPPALPS